MEAIRRELIKKKTPREANPQNIVIVVEGDEYMQEVHTCFCEKTFPGAKLFHFNNEFDAWTALRCGDIKISSSDIIIADCQVSNLDLAKRIKEDDIQIRVAIFGGCKTNERAARAAGVDVFVQKPSIIPFYAKLLWQ